MAGSSQRTCAGNSVGCPKLVVELTLRGDGSELEHLWGEESDEGQELLRKQAKLALLISLKWENTSWWVHQCYQPHIGRAECLPSYIS